MILLDTNVVSEFMRPFPSASVVAWGNRIRRSEQYLCAPVVAELRFGIERLPAGRRRQAYEDALADQIAWAFKDRVFDFDLTAANECGRVLARRERMGARVEYADAMIAAIALTRGLAIATRNTQDFSGLGLALINPFLENDE